MSSFLWTQPNRAVNGLSGAKTIKFLCGHSQVICHQLPRWLSHHGQDWPNQAGETTAPRTKVRASGHVNNQSRVAGISISRKSLRELFKKSTHSWRPQERKLFQHSTLHASLIVWANFWISLTGEEPLIRNPNLWTQFQGETSLQPPFLKAALNVWTGCPLGDCQ